MTTSLTPAQAAIRAAKALPQWGWYAARQYALKHGTSEAMWKHADRVETQRRKWKSV